jgi:hypothetical protein
LDSGSISVGSLGSTVTEFVGVFCAFFVHKQVCFIGLVLDTEGGDGRQGYSGKSMQFWLALPNALNS